MPRPTQLIPLGHTPLPVEGPSGVVGGWRVAVAEAAEDRLTLADRSPLAKVLLRAEADGPVAARLGVERGRARRHADGTLVAGFGPGEWLLLGPPGTAADLVAGWDGPAAGPSEGEELVSALDVTSARALMRLTGGRAPELLATVCAVDFDDRVTPNGSALRTSVAKVVTEIVRDDTHHLSYLLGCDASYGRYLHGALLDAGGALAVQAAGFSSEASR